MSWIIGCVLLALHSLAQTPSEFDFPNTPRLNQEQRLKVLNQVCETLRARYIGWNQTRPGYPGGEILCQTARAREVAIEDALTDSSWVSNLKFNYDFEDRLRLFFASFQDGHLYGSFESPRAKLSVLISFEEIQGKIRVSSVSPLLRAILSDRKKLQKGDEVLKIDHQSVEGAIQSLLSYISASTNEARRYDAISALTARRSVYPKQNSMTITLRNREGKEYAVQVPWYFRTDNEVAKKYCESQGFRSFQDAHYEQDSTQLDSKMKRILFYNIDDDRWNSAFENRWGKKNIKVAKNPYEEFFKVAEDAHYVWIRLLNFSEGAAEIEQNGEVISRVPKWTDALVQVLKDAKEHHKKVIVDLRNNSGGSQEVALEILSSLVKAREVFVYKANYFRIDDWSRVANLLQQDRESRCSQDPECVQKRKWALATFQSSLKDQSKNATLTTGYPIYDVGQSESSWDLPNQMLLLIGPGCISQCENFSRFLSMYLGVKTLGRPTHGTGYGFTGSFNFPDSTQTLRVDIPTHAFSVHRTPADPRQAIGIDLMEGCGFQPTYGYSSSLCDLTDDEIDLWVEIYRRFPPNSPR